MAAYTVGLLMFLGLRHWQAGLPWAQAVRDAAASAFIATLGGWVFRRAFRVGERRDDGHDG
ncbi:MULTISPECIES: hypothetical protein [unclassified Streptomyces]|uniref:hypothetical protein n=1 Tax=unclassified Streptomyces TaxID=2593676 RepID=UPI000FE1F36C|nr:MULTISPECIES: hypothetical protein [unclassified Streptomyces]